MEEAVGAGGPLGGKLDVPLSINTNLTQDPDNLLSFCALGSEIFLPSVHLSSLESNQSTIRNC